MVTSYYIMQMSEKNEHNSEFSEYYKTIKRDGLDSLSSLKCRVCLQTGSIPLFNSNNEAVRNTLAKITSIQIDENDNLPKQLCSTCYEFLEIAIQFRETAKQTEESCKQHVTSCKDHNDFKGSGDSIGSPEIDIEALNSTVEIDQPESMADSTKLYYMSECCDTKFHSLHELYNHQCTSNDITNKCNNESSYRAKETMKSYAYNKEVTIATKSISNACSKSKDTDDDYLKSFDIQYNEGKPPEKVTCKICNLTMKYLSMRLHFVKHNPNAPTFVCEYCGKVFIYKQGLERHQTIHLNDFPFQCTICPYKGRSKGLLRSHLRTHKSIYNYKCMFCPAKYKRSGSLRVHLQNHREPTLKCDLCTKAFHTKSRLKNHFEATHLGLRKYTCSMCEKVYATNKRKRNHEVKVHKKAKLKTKVPTYLLVQAQDSVKAD